MCGLRSGVFTRTEDRGGFVRTEERGFVRAEARVGGRRLCRSGASQARRACERDACQDGGFVVQGIRADGYAGEASLVSDLLERASLPLNRPRRA